MIRTANENLIKSGRENIKFMVMDNLKLEFPDEYFDIVVARNTVTNPKEIYRVLKKDGYVIIRGVDMYDCHSLRKVFDKVEGKTPISIIDYDGLIDANFKDVELVPIHQREYFKNRELFIKFLRKVPIIIDFDRKKDKDFNLKKLDLYIRDNTYDLGIRLLRRYYGITARK